MWVGQEGHRSSVVPWFSRLECLFILPQLTSSSFQLAVRVTASLCSWTIPQHRRHGQSHRQNAGRQLSEAGLGSASVVSTNLRSLSLFKSLSLGRPTSGWMAQQCVNRDIHFRLCSWTACRNQWVHPALNPRWHERWLRGPELATLSQTVRFSAAAAQIMPATEEIDPSH